MAKPKEKIFVRSILDLGDYNDDTINNEPSMTDPEQDEPIQKLVARLIRGEAVASKQVYYDEIGPETALPEVFAAQSVTERDGFDIADAPAILAAAAAAVKPELVPEPAPEPVSEPAPEETQK